MEPSAAPSGRVVAELAGAAVLLLWRVWAVPVRLLWQDWIAVVAVYWIWGPARDPARPRPVATAVAMAWLVGVYVVGQFPHTLQALGLR